MTVDVTTMVDMGITTSTTTKAPYPQVNIRKFSPANRPSTTKRPKSGERPGFKPKYSDRKNTVNVNEPQSDQPQVKSDFSSLLPPGYKIKTNDDKSSKLLEEILSKVKTPKLEETGEGNIDISKFLPPGYKLPDEGSSSTESSIFKSTKLSDNDEKTTEKSSTESSISKNTKTDDLSKFLPPGYKLPKSEEKTTESSNVFKNTKADDISKFLPPGYKLRKSEEKTTESGILKNTKTDDISKFLPPGYKLPKTMTTTESSIFKNTKADDISKFLPPGYKLRPSTTQKPKESEPEIKSADISSFLPPGYKPPKDDSSNGKHLIITDNQM